jgi:hypothetical protein
MIRKEKQLKLWFGSLHGSFGFVAFNQYVYYEVECSNTNTTTLRKVIRELT